MSNIELEEPICIIYRTTPEQLEALAARMRKLRLGDSVKMFEHTIGKIGNRPVRLSVALEQ